jgi:enoyl-CoA hydratase/3-hydroxyacyl-CoA dehydrogenase
MEITKVGVVGGGLMGAGIAQVAAQAGYATVVRELNQELLDKALNGIRAFLDKGVANRKMTQAKRDATWACISGTTELADLADCDLIIEAIFENLDAKREVFHALDGICRDTAILASITSSLSIAHMAAVTKRPDRVVGLHYFFPPVINQLVEIAVLPETAREVVETLLVFARVTGKVPIITRDAPGFAVNRFFLPWLNEAARMLGEGVANIATIDKAGCDTFHIGMGPFALMNATRVPIAYHATSAAGQTLGEFYVPAASLVAQFQSGQPFDLAGEVDESALPAVGDRLLGVAFGVAAELVEEGVATVEDTDRGALIGLRWARGPFGMMNDVGLDRALALVEALAARHASFTVPELLRKQAATGQPWPLRDVKLEVASGIATITMNRPEAMNALNGKVLRELKETIAQVRDDPNVRVVIITGEGPAFVAGADIRAMMTMGLVDIREFIHFGQAVLSDIEKLEKPVVAAINGFALGGGLELALACDIRLASTEAQMGFPEVGLGIYPGFGGTQRATRLLGKGRASELVFTGDPINAEEAARIGLVNRAVPPRQLIAEARRLAARIASRGPVAVGRAKASINQALQTGLDAGFAFEAEGVTLTFGTEDKQEGMAAFVEKRRPEFKGH